MSASPIWRRRQYRRHRALGRQVGGQQTWTFDIRPGIKSWAGNETTSADIKWTWERAFEMKAVCYFFAKVMFLDKPDDIEVLGKYTVKFNLQKPSPVILKLMAMSYYGGPFDVTEVKKHATATDPWAKEWLKSNDAGFGPYHIVKNIPGQEMELTRNENYEPKPPIKRILIRIVPDPATGTALLERGAIDYAMRIPERSLQALAKNPNVQIVRARAMRRSTSTRDSRSKASPPRSSRTTPTASGWTSSTRPKLRHCSRRPATPTAST